MTSSVGARGNPIRRPVGALMLGWPVVNPSATAHLVATSWRQASWSGALRQDSKCRHWGVPRSGPADPTQRTDAQVRARFDELREQWIVATAGAASAMERFRHPAYQQIIGLGQPAVPLLVDELRSRPDHWFWALSCITGLDAAEGSTTIGDAAQRWIAWATEVGYVR
ncbi:MAG: hypothetical protein QG597_1247 [Actinomycetota bacterium]|nr:hypothetical protein [Actinomycetota bacterium]